MLRSMGSQRVRHDQATKMNSIQRNVLVTVAGMMRIKAGPLKIELCCDFIFEFKGKRC